MNLNDEDFAWVTWGIVRAMGKPLEQLREGGSNVECYQDVSRRHIKALT